jgi:rSAM/selenodomain-associated transferase 2
MVPKARGRGLRTPLPDPLSVIVPTLDEADRILALLRSVHALLGPADELILVDGGSSDGTLEVALEASFRYGLNQLRVLTSRRGRGAQMNRGAEAARGSWFLFLHADSVLDPRSLDAIHAVMRDPSAAWGHFRVRLDDPGLTFRWIELGINLRSRAWSTPSGDQGVFVRKSTFLEVGGYPEIPLMEDLILVDRLRRQGPPSRLRLGLRTSARRWRQQGIVPTVLRMWALRAAFRLGVSPERLARHYPKLT